MASLEYWKGIIAKEYHGQLEKKVSNRNPRSPSNLERTTRNKPLAKKITPRFTGPVRICIATVRKVLPRDHHAISEKYVLDSIVSANILQDDSQKYIPEPPEIKVLCGIPEMTRIEIEEI
jgi:hypothetical protein